MSAMLEGGALGVGVPLWLLVYVDPGTGSLVFQVLAAGLLGVVMGFRNLRTWIGTRLARWTGRRHARPVETRRGHGSPGETTPPDPSSGADRP